MAQQSQADSCSTNVSIETILRLVPDFNTDEVGHIYRFIRSCDAAFRLANARQVDILLVYTLNRISGTGAPDVHSRNYDSWDTLKRYLISRFSNVKTISHLMLELQSSFQKHNESITEYFHRIDLCRSKIIEKLNAEISDSSLHGRKKCTEETALSVFINGLSSDMGTMLRTREFSSLNEVGQFAIQEDKIRKMNIARQNLFRAHYSHKLPIRTSHTPAPRPVILNRNIPNPGQMSRPTPHAYTGSPNRTISSSYDPNKVCNYCKKTGHIISECRKRAYNNSLNLQRPNLPINHLNSMTVTEEGNSLTYDDNLAQQTDVILPQIEELQITSNQ